MLILLAGKVFDELKCCFEANGEIISGHREHRNVFKVNSLQTEFEARPDLYIVAFEVERVFWGIKTDLILQKRVFFNVGDS